MHGPPILLSSYAVRIISCGTGVLSSWSPFMGCLSGSSDLDWCSSDDPLTMKRDEWKARTKTEGDSKALSASIASSTCHKAGAHPERRNDIGERKRGREESRIGTSQSSRQTDEPARFCFQCPLSLVQRQGNPIAEKRNNPMGRPIPAPHPLTLE